MIALSLLLVLVAYMYLAKATVKAVGRRYPGWLAKALTIAVFVLIPTWDIVPGQLYFNHLCKTEAGQKIYKTVEVGPEYILKPGEPDRSRLNARGDDYVAASGGEINWAKLREERYANPDQIDRYFSTLFHIDKVSSFVQDKQTGEILGTATSFWYFGGWLSDFLSDHTSPSECPSDDPTTGFSAHSTLLRKIIQPATVTPGKGN